MAKHLTWCLKRMFSLTNRFNVPQRSMILRNTTDFGILPEHPQEDKLNVDCEEPKGFNEFADERKTGKAFAVTVLSKILDITQANAMKTVEEYPAFQFLSKKTVYNNFQILREEGVYKSTIKDHKFLLSHSTEELKTKISCIQTFHIDINEAVYLFRLSTLLLMNFVKRSKMEASYLPNDNRIFYLAQKLKREVGEMCRLLSYNHYLLTMPAPKLLTVTEYLLEVGVTPEDLGTDLHVYNYGINMIKEKLERAKALGIQPLKTWVLRCPAEVWEKTAMRRQQFETMLANQTVPEYLCELFECDIETVNYIVFKYPRILRIRLEKLVNITKLLRKHGYRIEDIQRSPLVLNRSFKTLEEYFDICKEMGWTEKVPLSQFLISRENFKKYLKSKCSVSPKVETK